MTEDTPSIAAFAVAFRMLASGVMPNSLEVIHSGRCGRCARKLTVPESVASGFGRSAPSLSGPSAPPL